MNSEAVGTPSKVYWFVGAAFGGTDDQTTRFLNESIWEIRNPTDKELALVRSMAPGNRIAIKSSYVRKNNLPFDNRGNYVSVMGIKAVGTIKSNPGDGIRIQVEWEKTEPIREWYFYTYRPTIWRVLPGDWAADALIEFAFENRPQDLPRFRNNPYWKERFGDITSDKLRFKWTVFYQAMADKLLAYKDRRAELIAAIHEISMRVEGLSNLEDQFANGTTGPLEDICPFTTMGIFNRGISDSNRKIIATEMAKFLRVEETIPDTFEGIPVLNNQRSWYFGYSKDRKPGDIDALWNVFAEAIRFSDSEDSEARSTFIKAYDSATQIFGVGWNLTMGLYWIRPWSYLTLDRQSQTYISQKLGINIGKNGPKGRCNAKDYLTVLEDIEARFQEDAYPVHSFPELSLAAWHFKGDDEGKKWKIEVYARIKDLCLEKKSSDFSRKDFLSKYLEHFQDLFPTNKSIANTIARNLQILRDEGKIEFVERGLYRLVDFDSTDSGEEQEDVPPEVPLMPYSLDDILADGCFIERPKLKQMLDRLRDKRNLILQGPPGTGKTWLAKRLAFALIGQRDESRILVLQFHANLSYEDFVRGWRPDMDGKLSLIDGPFLEMSYSALKNPKEIHVVVIEEINRGNPAQIFGEMLTLLEVDKRTPEEAIQLCYRRETGERFFIPDNLYIIGTMNIADRSIALVDLALRRRFAFIDLEPIFGKVWRDWVQGKCGISDDILSDIEKRVISLNEEIAADTSLGPQFRIGHSYVTPPFGKTILDPREWFMHIVDTEIGPLLQEYWFDALEKARKARQKLTDGF
jgi:5-methylcytosine-specific restriction protein B